MKCKFEISPRPYQNRFGILEMNKKVTCSIAAMKKKYYVIGMFILVSITSYAQLPAAGDCIDAIRLCDQNQIYHYEANGPGAIDDANGANTLYCQNQTSAG